MPLVGWTRESTEFAGHSCEPDFTHKDGKGQEVECMFLDHYARRCPEPPFPRLLAEELYRGGQFAARYGELDPRMGISITLLRRDPLLTRLEREFPYVSDPLDEGLLYMLRGTFVHKALLTPAPNLIVEQPLKVTLDGIDVYGTVDMIDFRGKEPVIADLKTQKKWALDKKLKMSNDDILKDPYVQDHRFQIQAYRVMVHDVMGLEIEATRLEFWDTEFRTVRVMDHPVSIPAMRERMTELAVQMHDALVAENLSKIPASDGKHIAVKRSGLYYLWNEYAN